MKLVHGTLPHVLGLTVVLAKFLWYKPSLQHQMCGMI